MKRISVDISGCDTADEIYLVLLSALGAPSWHGRNLDAIWDGITSGIVNLEQPCALDVVTKNPPSREVSDLLHDIAGVFEEARLLRKLNVKFNLL